MIDMTRMFENPIQYIVKLKEVVSLIIPDMHYKIKDVG